VLERRGGLLLGTAPFSRPLRLRDEHPVLAVLFLPHIRTRVATSRSTTGVTTGGFAGDEVKAATRRWQAPGQIGRRFGEDAAGSAAARSRVRVGSSSSRLAS
jgi:hypothetical protein